MRRLLIALILTVVSPLTGQESGVVVVQVSDTRLYFFVAPVPFTPPSAFLGAWQDVAKCIGLESVPEPKPVTWSIADGIIQFNPQTGAAESARGVTLRYRDGRYDVIMDSNHYVSEDAVRHEMIHLMVDDFGHSRLELYDRCERVPRAQPDDVGELGRSAGIDLTPGPNRFRR